MGNNLSDSSKDLKFRWDKQSGVIGFFTGKSGGLGDGGGNTEWRFQERRRFDS